MLTIQQAQELGWQIDVEGSRATARKTRDDLPVAELHITSDIPMFMAVMNIAEYEGFGFVAGYGGEEEVTPELVQAVSGESYEPDVAPPPEPPPPPEPTQTERVIEALVSLPELSAASKKKLKDALAEPKH